MLQQGRHYNIVSPLQIFAFEGSFHEVLKYTVIRLSGVAANPRSDMCPQLYNMGIK